MPENYVLLERTELNATAASVTFANIPQTGYTDLKIVVSARSTGSSVGMSMLLNGSSANISTRGLEGNGASAVSYTSTNILGYIVPSGATANTFGNTEIYIPNYRSSSNKSISVDSVNETNATTAYSLLNAFLWSNTAAITSLTLQSDTTSTNSLAAGSTFSLYGIAALGTTPAIAPKASGGNRIDNDGTYWYHTFTSSGSFVPQTPLTADMLVIAGGGGGGGDIGGGGGAGRVYALTSQSLLSATNYACTIGAGGATNNLGINGPGLKGTDSSFIGGSLSYTSLGGGGGNGRAAQSTVVNDGWNGGGGSYDSSRGPTSGNGGNAGGATTNPQTTNCQAGGGGGAGAAGSTVGGAGTNTYSTWATATSTGVSGFYAGGGGGGFYSNTTTAAAGGSGGGGNGGNNNAAGTNGTVSTGSGGGGAGSTGSVPAGTGGSGIVIIRYPIAS
jgi:hypothetical protein